MLSNLDKATEISTVEGFHCEDISDLSVAVVSDASPGRNGVGSYYQDLMAYLQPRLESAQLYCPGPMNRVWHRYLTAPLPGDGTQRVMFPPVPSLWRSLYKTRPDAIVVPTPGPYGLTGSVFAKRLGIPLITGFHTHYEALAGMYWDNRWGQFCRGYLNWCNRLFFRHSKLVLANSMAMVDAAAELGAEDARLMGTSVSPLFLAGQTRRLSVNCDRLLFAGRLAEEKNILKILELAQRAPDFNITIVGDGPLREAVESEATRLSNLKYLGWVDRKSLVSVVDDHDVLLLPSTVESFGTVALEAMARGRLVAVTRGCGICEWPSLERHLIKIASPDSLPQMVNWIRETSVASRQRQADLGMEAARLFSSDNVDQWIKTIATCRSGEATRHAAA